MNSDRNVEGGMYTKEPPSVLEHSHSKATNCLSPVPAHSPCLSPVPVPAVTRAKEGGRQKQPHIIRVLASENLHLRPRSPNARLQYTQRLFFYCESSSENTTSSIQTLPAPLTARMNTTSTVDALEGATATWVRCSNP